jgi:lysophospholipase L1-like esterase
LPLHRAEENKANGATLCDYVNVMKELLTEKEIDFLDFYNNGPEKPLSKEPNEFFLDGLHPNDKGHLWIAEQVIKYVKTK